MQRVRANFLMSPLPQAKITRTSFLSPSACSFPTAWSSFISLQLMEILQSTSIFFCLSVCLSIHPPICHIFPQFLRALSSSKICDLTISLIGTDSYVYNQYHYKPGSKKRSNCQFSYLVDADLASDVDYLVFGSSINIII